MCHYSVWIIQTSNSQPAVYFLKIYWGALKSHILKWQSNEKEGTELPLGIKLSNYQESLY